MAAKSEQPNSNSRRAGLPLARAQRLAARTDTRKLRGPGIYVALGLAVVGATVAYAVVAGTQPGPIGSPAVAATAEPASTPSAVAVAAVPLPGPATIEIAAGDSAAADAPVESPAPRTAEAPACISAIENRLETLRADAAAGLPWTKQQQGLAELVQATLDCGDAGLEIVGSLELAGSDLADLRVRWDHAEWVLDLAMIDAAGAPADQTAPSPDGRTTEFLIR